MQTTLLGLAIAIILALVAALVGPLMIDWGGYRALFEAEASHLVGLDVRVKGKIDARLLPSPQLTLHEIALGPDGERAVRARSLDIEFALGPLMRGEWRASEMHLAGPQLTLGLDAAGHVQTPMPAVGFDPEVLTIDRLTIQDGTLTFADAASGAKLTLNHLWFNGEARSLLGPFKGEGAATIANELYPYRISVARYAGDGKLKLHINVDPVNHPVSIESDGALSLAGDTPRFDGNLSLARPVGIASEGAGEVSQPWRIGAKLKVTPVSALVENLTFDYGSFERGFQLTGVADFKFGERPRFNGLLSGRQIDLDRALTGGDAAPPPAAAIRKLAALAGGAFRPSIPITIGVGIDQITLGGEAVQNLRGDISSSARGWNLDRFEFRAPGYAQVRLSGRLAIDDDRVAFTGPAEVKANNPKALAAWLEGRKQAGGDDLRPLTLRGDLTLASDRIAVERLDAQFDRRPVTGRLVYVFKTDDRPASLDAALKAPELDLDAALGFGKALLAGSTVERPHDVTVAADIGNATIAGFNGRDVSARLKIDPDGLQIDKLSVADLGGAAFSASGRIVTTPGAPQGSMRVDLDAPDMTPVVGLLGRFAPATARVLGHSAPAMAPAKLHARLAVEGGKPAAIAKLAVEGSLGKARLVFNGETDADLTSFATGDIKLDGKLTAADGKVLVSMLGLDRMVAVDAGAGALTLTANGRLRGDWRVSGKLTANGLEANTTGTARPFADKPSVDLRVTVPQADAAPLRRPGSGEAAKAAKAAMPVKLAGRLALDDKQLSLRDIDARLGGATLRGDLAMMLEHPRRLKGALAADYVDGAGLVAAAVGMPAPVTAKNAAWGWSSEPFGAGIFGDYTGEVDLKARRLDLLPQLSAREFSARMNFGKNEFALQDIAGHLNGGRLSGWLTFRAAEEGLTARSRIALAGADAAGLLTAGARPAIGGTLSLTAETEGTGLSPVALIGSMKGAGKLALGDAQLAGLDPRAFDAVTRAVDRGLSIEPERISDVVSKTLQSGRLTLKRAQGDLSIVAGQVRLTKFSADSSQAHVSLDGSLDLIDGSVDARLVLSGPSEAAGARPDIFMALGGPVTGPTRTIDVSALTGWLTLRAIERQAKQLREIERAQPKTETAPALPQTDVAPAPPQTGATPAPQRKQPAKPDRGAAPASAGTPTAAPKKSEAAAPKLAPAAAPKRRQAPALPPPLEIKPLPVPGSGTRPEASAGAQN